jgi:hypothetical protein
MKPRTFWLWLILIALAGLIIRVDIGSKTFIDFDEWQHLFMAASPRWEDLLFELRTNAHPPLFFLLLGWVEKLGQPALYRAISIAAGTGSIVMAGLIARRLFDSPLIQLACAAAFALSVDAITISDEIRSYQLAVFLVLVAFRAWLDAASLRGAIVFAIASSLALLSHYSAIFFVAACAVLLFWRRRLIAAVAVAVPLALFSAEYFLHAGAQPQQGYLFDFYFGKTAGETLPGFLLRNLGNFFNLFSPVTLQSAAAAAAAVAIFCALAVWAFRRKSGPVILLAAVMVVEMMAASILGKYPFGGLLRHQYIAGPFLLLAAFAVLDRMTAAFRHLPRYAIPALALCIGATGFAAHRSSLIRLPGYVLLTEQYRDWRAAFPHAQAVYVDHWSAISYFIHTSTEPRTFVRPIPDAAEIDEYRTPGGIHIFYDKTRELVNVADPTVYASIVSCLRQSGLREITIFLTSPGMRPLNLHNGKLESIVAKRASSEGLRLTKLALGPTYAAAGFTLQ